MKPLRKKILISVVFVVIFGVFLFVVLMSANIINYEKQKQGVNGGTMSWLQALCDKDYVACDSYVASDGFKITGFDRTAQGVTNPVSTKLYYQFIDYAVDSIKSIEVISIKENKSTGYTEYEVKVEYIPYEKIDNLVVDKDKLNTLMDKYTSGEMYDDDFSIEIQNYYLELFSSCFTLSSDDNVTSKVLILSEKEDADGVVFVYNTKAFIEGLISDEMYGNLEVYQSNIKAKVDTVLRQY